MAGARRDAGAMSAPSAQQPGSGRPEPAHAGAQYVCPMHPEVRQDRPGTCPKCGMQLQAEQPGEPRAGEEHAADHVKMLREMRAPWLWTNATVMMLGLWLLSSPFTFSYTKPAMIWSDVVSGVLLVLFAGIAYVPRFDFVGRWLVSLVGIWLQFAPLVFWAPTATAYLNDTLVGALAITLSILVPMMPGMAHHMAMMKPGPEIPPGWSYNPSSWHQRMPMVGLGLPDG